MLQLAALGYILAPAFALGSWWLVGLEAAALIAVAAAEIVSRPGASYKVQPFLVHLLTCRKVLEMYLASSQALSQLML